MKRFGLRRGLSALVLVTASVGLITVGSVGQASAVSGVVPVAGGSKTANPNNTITKQVTADVNAGDTVIVSVATGTFAGTVGCADDAGNSYALVADKNTGSGRLFVCASTLANPLTTSNTISASYPGFSGVSVISAIAVDPSLTYGFSGPISLNAGSNPPVSSGSITVDDTFLFGVVAHSNVSTFTPTSSPGCTWTVVGEQSGGTGASKRTVTPVWCDVFGGTFAASGTLSGSGFWQAGIVTFTT